MFDGFLPETLWIVPLEWMFRQPRDDLSLFSASSYYRYQAALAECCLPSRKHVNALLVATRGWVVMTQRVYKARLSRKRKICVERSDVQGGRQRLSLVVRALLLQ